MTVRTRFAPSPTGYLHIGGARTALYAWLYARKHGGQFVLRIEDTDQDRSTQESVQAILDGMQWLGLEHDEGPIYQSHRFKRYAEVAEQLLQGGHAYRCTCSRERMTKLREEQIAAKQKPRYDGHCRDKNQRADKEHVIRFKNPQTGQVSFSDQVYGDITVNNSELDDVILVRSDGVPTYNFSVVIDDSDMQITHVIRGDDHINNTPRQINIMQALALPVPTYAHLPMILGDDGKRLSKRHGAVSVMQFAHEGYLPHALLNYLVRLGWSHGDQEIFSSQEMIELFDLEHVQRAGAGFDMEKLRWLNAHYLREMPHADVAELLSAQLQDHDIDLSQGPAVIEVAELLLERSQTVADMFAQAQSFYSDEVSYDEEAVAKQLSSAIKAPLFALVDNLEACAAWDSESINEVIKATAKAHELKFGKLAMPFRVAIMGSTSSPSIAQTACLIGKERIKKRVTQAFTHV